jgi:hypothetical protein
VPSDDISKAIALLLKGSVPEAEIVQMVLRHLGRHIASSDEGADGSGVSRFRNTREYLNAGFSGDRLLSEMGQSILRDDNGWNLVHGLRVVFDEWQLCEGHPARNQLLIGLSRWATDVRKRAGSQSAAQTALRFARGQTAVDLYES